MAFLTPVSHDLLAKYHITQATVYWIYVVIFIPLYIIWYTAFYGFSALQTYAQRIKKHRDGAAMQLVANGVMLLAVASPFVSAVSGVIRYVGGNTKPSTIETQVVTSNALTLLFMVAGLVLVYLGATRLNRMTRKPLPQRGLVLFNLVFLAVSVVYTYLFVVHLQGNRSIPVTATTHPVYYSPTWVLMPGLLIPYLLSWYLGFLSIYQFRSYRLHIGAPIYAAALRSLSYGIGLVVVTSVVTQVLSVFNGQLQSLTVAGLLVAIYLLLIVMGSGYLLMARGAHRLLKIEEA
jgi:hypothetical protein